MNDIVIWGLLRNILICMIRILCPVCVEIIFGMILGGCRNIFTVQYSFHFIILVFVQTFRDENIFCRASFEVFFFFHFYENFVVNCQQRMFYMQIELRWRCVSVGNVVF